MIKFLILLFEKELMSSFEEERLIQMVHDFIESESSPPTFPASSKGLYDDDLPSIATLQEALVSVTEAEEKVLESVLRHMRSKRTAEKITGLKKWLVMKLRMDGFRASFCHTSWATSCGCPAGDYEYIDIILKHGNYGDEPPRLIIDIDFRSQFELARPTPSYKRLMDKLPHIFVGTEDKLNKIISVLCSAAKQSLKERGLHVPPWRTTTYMQCKWLSGSNKVTDCCCNSVAYPGENRDSKNNVNGSP